MQQNSKHLNTDIDQKKSPRESPTGKDVLSTMHTLQSEKKTTGRTTFYKCLNMSYARLRTKLEIIL